MDGTLFEMPAAQARQDSDKGTGRPRLKRANRQQVQWQPMDLDGLLGEEHAARLVWEFVQELDLSVLYGDIRAVEGHAGQSAIDPRLLMALWLYATLEGVGSARALDRLCQEHVAYLWILGGVTVNYHTLAEFRVSQGEVLNQLLSESVASLMAEGLVSLERTAQDGVRVRASAGGKSFRQRAKLEDCLHEAEAEVERLRAELEVDPGASSRRQRAARERARRERVARVRQALKQMEALEERRGKSTCKGSQHKATRASTTDPEACIMKMADGGFRPGYNVQMDVETEGRLIVGVGVTNAGADQGQMASMVEQEQQRYGQAAGEHLVDGGFATHRDIQEVAAKGVVVYAPVPEARVVTKPPHGPPEAPPAAVIAWRKRMETEEAQAIYKQRASTVEWVNAMLRNRGLQQFTVRGLEKVKAVVLWFCLLHNLLIRHKLRQAAAA
jgi:transposase